MMGDLIRPDGLLGGFWIIVLPALGVAFLIWGSWKRQAAPMILGVISLIGGVMQLLGMHTLEGAILLIILGAYLMLKPWFDKQRLLGKAEGG